MGEYPLAWAACCANESVYNLLIDSNADPDAQDTFGNMILHMVVVCDKLVGSLNRTVLASLHIQIFCTGHVRICIASSKATGQERDH